MDYSALLQLCSRSVYALSSDHYDTNRYVFSVVRVKCGITNKAFHLKKFFFGGITLPFHSVVKHVFLHYHVTRAWQSPH